MLQHIPHAAPFQVMVAASLTPIPPNHYLISKGQGWAPHQPAQGARTTAINSANKEFLIAISAMRCVACNGCYWFVLNHPIFV
jgi:hypothetical protein